MLAAVLRLGDGGYGAAILMEIQAQTGRRVSRGSLYVTLDRLEQRRLIKIRVGDRAPERGGRPRRYVRVTRNGLEAVRDVREALLFSSSAGPSGPATPCTPSRLLPVEHPPGALESGPMRVGIRTRRIRIRVPQTSTGASWRSSRSSHSDPAGVRIASTKLPPAQPPEAHS